MSTIKQTFAKKLKKLEIFFFTKVTFSSEVILATARTTQSIYIFKKWAENVTTFYVLQKYISVNA